MSFIEFYENEENPKIIYNGVFLTKKGKVDLIDNLKMLLNKQDYDGAFENKFFHHVTTSFKPQEPPKNLGSKTNIKVVGYARDDKGEAIVVDVAGIPVENKIPHITLTTNKGVKPFYSNELVNNGFEPIKPFEIEGVIGYFNGKVVIN